MTSVSTTSDPLHLGVQLEADWLSECWSSTNFENTSLQHWCELPCTVCGQDLEAGKQDMRNLALNQANDNSMAVSGDMFNMGDVRHVSDHCERMNCDPQLPYDGPYPDPIVHLSSSEGPSMTDVAAYETASDSGCWEQFHQQRCMVSSVNLAVSGQAYSHENSTRGSGVWSLAFPVMNVKPRVRRRKFGHGDKHSLGGRPTSFVDNEYLTPIALTLEALRTHFGKPLCEAARSIGICATALKKTCRKLGIKEWPFQRIKPIQKRLAKLQSSSTLTPRVLREIHDLQAQKLALQEGRELECFSDNTFCTRYPF